MNLRESNNRIGIDKFLENNKGFWQDLEIFCVAECCGVDAFDFSRESINEVVQHYNLQNILSDLNGSIDLIHRSSSKLISSSILNHCVSKKKFFELLENIKQVLLRVSV